MFADVDSDGDTVSACKDECTYNMNKQEVGICGCGIAHTDTDGNGVADCKDLCPMEEIKSNPGVYGRAVEDIDSDADGTMECKTSAPATARRQSSVCADAMFLTLI